MFRALATSRAPTPSFPRVRGDVPLTYPLWLDGIEFSPRARGCSSPSTATPRALKVFPACAGMFLLCPTTTTWARSFPRVRGDVPPSHAVLLCALGFSPRARGCSSPTVRVQDSRTVFPACAGMFHPARPTGTWGMSFPRVRGDVPKTPSARPSRSTFSPRARGCSACGDTIILWVIVFPACAGMFLLFLIYSSSRSRFPRVRGDVPEWNFFSDISDWFSPRARGCSPVSPALVRCGGVFPACAGMFPVLPAVLSFSGGFPRVRGDVPA